MAASVNFFNAGSLNLNVSVNNGSPFAVPGAGAPSWTPQTPSTNPAFTPGPPGPGSLGLGSNMISVTSQGSAPLMFQISLSPNVNWQSIQVYLFQTYGQCSWVLLNGGQLIAQGTA